jgi:hypothetical protein
MKINEVTAIVLVCFICAFVVGCAGFEVRVGFAGYNENAESRKFVNEAGVPE